MQNTQSGWTEKHKWCKGISYRGNNAKHTIRMDRRTQAIQNYNTNWREKYKKHTEQSRRHKWHKGSSKITIRRNRIKGTSQIDRIHTWHKRKISIRQNNTSDRKIKYQLEESVQNYIPDKWNNTSDTKINNQLRGIL